MDGCSSLTPPVRFNPWVVQPVVSYYTVMLSQPTAGYRVRKLSLLGHES